jgi:Ca2+/Na+ antiporter
VGNYRTQTTPAELEYLEITGHQLGREPLTGGIILGITLIGIVVTISKVNVAERKKRRRMFLFLLAFLTIAFGHIVMVPLPWQRYSMPLIPFISLYFGIGFAWVIKNSRRFIPHGRISNQLSKVLSQFSPDSWMS